MAEPYASFRHQGMQIARRRDDVSPPGRRIRRETTRGAGPVDAHAAQLRRQMDATLTRLEQHVSRIPAGLLEQQALGPVRDVQETAAPATAWLPPAIWHGLSVFSYTDPGGIRFAY